MKQQFHALSHGPAIKLFDGAKGIIIHDSLGDEECIVAQVYDNFLNGKNLVYLNTALFLHSPALQQLLLAAIDRWPEFDTDSEVSGADLVDWFGAFRTRVKEALQAIKNTAIEFETDAGIALLQTAADVGEDSVLPKPDESRSSLCEIKAEIHSDDRVFEVPFNASAWFEEADAHQIRELAENRWGESEVADCIGRMFEDQNPQVKELFSYLHRVAGTSKACGFTVTVDQETARAWLMMHRPELGSTMDDDGLFNT